ncbi:hypothetical protein P7K49_012029 [Saguinus oedipus]|uniref:Uncharacterized protein n=1 Tax=Saguinus oedipus TaxID=9490 RepID=A0ABQ9VVW0_SAGOE|nr:hypothetical protein P7K49_012029 [Saguinus oedipus]
MRQQKRIKEGITEEKRKYMGPWLNEGKRSSKFHLLLVTGSCPKMTPGDYTLIRPKQCYRNPILHFPCRTSLPLELLLVQVQTSGPGSPERGRDSPPSGPGGHVVPPEALEKLHKLLLLWIKESHAACHEEGLGGATWTSHYQTTIITTITIISTITTTTISTTITATIITTITIAIITTIATIITTMITIITTTITITITTISTTIATIITTMIIITTTTITNTNTIITTTTTTITTTITIITIFAIPSPSLPPSPPSSLPPSSPPWPPSSSPP